MEGVSMSCTRMVARSKGYDGLKAFLAEMFLGPLALLTAGSCPRRGGVVRRLLIAALILIAGSAFGHETGRQHSHVGDWYYWHEVGHVSSSALTVTDGALVWLIRNCPGGPASDGTVIVVRGDNLYDPNDWGYPHLFIRLTWIHSSGETFMRRFPHEVDHREIEGRPYSMANIYGSELEGAWLMATKVAAELKVEIDLADALENRYVVFSLDGFNEALAMCGGAS